MGFVPIKRRTRVNPQATNSKPLHDLFDHRYLNEVEGLTNPTSENLARFIWDQVHPKLPILESITVRETCVARCEYRGP